MAQLYLGMRAHTWGIGLALVAPFLWWFLWKWRGRRFWNKAWFKIFKGSEEHEELLEMQAKYVGRLVNYGMWILIILVDMNMLGIIKPNSTTSRNIWIAGGTVTAGVFIGGGTYLSFLLSGIRLLLEKGFGTGNYIQCYSHKYHKVISGWVEELSLFKTTIRSDIVETPNNGEAALTLYTIRNSLLLEYITNNFDSGPFYHEIFRIPVSNENKRDVLPSEGNPDGSIIKKLKAEVGTLLITSTDRKDRDAFEKIFKDMDDSTWIWLSQPSILLENDHAVLRVPVRSYRHGLVLKHEISRHGILEV